MLPAVVISKKSYALLRLGRALKERDYKFITITPTSHARVLKRPASQASLTDIFGWSRPFDPADIEPALLELLEQAGALESIGSKLKSNVRFSTVEGLLLLHSGYPTDRSNSVFLGPDTYRFVHAIKWALAERPSFKPNLVVDIGAGSGAAGLLCAGLFKDAEVLLADINSDALGMAAVNAELNCLNAQPVYSDVLEDIAGSPDLIVSNPPYLFDAARRAYRNGGGEWGCDLSIRILADSLRRRASFGKLLLYTGAPVVRGVDQFFDCARPLLQQAQATYRYEEVDPDVFGEELERAPYDAADRIAAVTLIVD